MVNEIAIEPAFSAYLDMTSESFAGKAADLTEENLQSRVRERPKYSATGMIDRP